MEELLDVTFERYFNDAALMGTPETCKQTIRRFERLGVNEIACLIDFGIETEYVMESLEYLSRLKDSVAARGREAADEDR
jgi:hypothetical protein